MDSKMQEDDLQKNHSENKVKTTQIGLHSVKNILGNEQQLTLFSDHRPKEFAKNYGIDLERDIPKFGIDLTDTQQRVMEAILHGFTQTKYEGNLKPQDKKEHVKEKYPSGQVPVIYKYIQHLPRLRATQSEILKWSNIDREDPSDKERAIKALNHLATHQYCFYYTRLALDENGNPIKDKDGDWKKEEVVAVDTLFTIKEVRDKKRNILEYYEITPSTIFLDQRESYFMLIPYNWRQEVRKLVGQRKASSYTFRFLIFLRYQFELNRRSPKQKKPYIIRWSPEEIATMIKMPNNFYRRQKTRANTILEETYTVAKQLGYITDFERTGTLDILYLNEEKYHMPKNQEKLFISEEEHQSSEILKAKELLDFFIEEKRKIIPTYNPPGDGSVRRASLKYLALVINQHTFEEAKRVISWGFNKPFWCTRIGTPSNLYKYFNEAICEMNVSLMQKESKDDDYQQKNKDLANKISRQIKSISSKINIDVLNQYVEIGDGSHHVTCINYSEKGFKDQFLNALTKWGVSTPHSFFVN